MITNQKSQTFSMDIILAVIVFAVAAAVFYSLLSGGPSTKAGPLKEEASIVIKQVASEESPLSVIINETISTDKLNELKSLSYDELKRRFRIEGDFCIFLEDEEGNIILIDNNYKGIGSPNIDLSGTPCSQ
mgnify:CR=1 FL=1